MFPSVQDSGSNAKSEVTSEYSQPIRNVLRSKSSKRSVSQHLEGKKIEVLDALSQGKLMFHDTVHVQGLTPEGPIECLKSYYPVINLLFSLAAS